jgi:transposase
VSVKETSVCIVDDTGRIVREVKVASEPEALLPVLTNPTYHFERIGLEAGPLSQWLFSALAEAGLPVICVETLHMRAVLRAQINKTDRRNGAGRLTMRPQWSVTRSQLNSERYIRPLRLELPIVWLASRQVTAISKGSTVRPS